MGFWIQIKYPFSKFKWNFEKEKKIWNWISDSGQQTKYEVSDTKFKVKDGGHQIYNWKLLTTVLQVVPSIHLNKCFINKPFSDQVSIGKYIYIIILISGVLR